jgi:hypothetical protein
MIRVLLIALALTACARQPIKPDDPVDLRCNPACETACDVRVPEWQPADPNSPTAWDELVTQVLIPLAAKAETCEARRAACVACIDRGREHGVIR